MNFLQSMLALCGVGAFLGMVIPIAPPVSAICLLTLAVVLAAQYVVAAIREQTWELRTADRARQPEQPRAAQPTRTNSAGMPIIKPAVAMLFMLCAVPAAATPILDAHLEPTPPPSASMPPLMWGWNADAKPQRFFTAINSGALDHIELFGGGHYPAEPSMELLDEQGLLLATSAPTSLQDGWAPFVFADVGVEAGRTYQLKLPLPPSVSVALGTNWRVNVTSWGEMLAYRAYVEPAIVQPRLLGDADNSGKVDLEDFGILKEHFGTDGTEGDFTGDNRVDIHDFGILKDNFGKTGPPIIIDPVPEPAAAILALVAAALLLVGSLGCSPPQPIVTKGDIHDRIVDEWKAASDAENAATRRVIELEGKEASAAPADKPAIAEELKLAREAQKEHADRAEAARLKLAEAEKALPDSPDHVAP